MAFFFPRKDGSHLDLSGAGHEDGMERDGLLAAAPLSVLFSH